jgi:hypothetical protein
MESVRFARELFSNQKKEKPGYQNAGDALSQPEAGGKGRTPGERHAREFLQAGAAKDAVIVFGDAFATEELCAFRAASHCFAFGMVQTASVSQALHHINAAQEMIRGGALTSSAT